MNKHKTHSWFSMVLMSAALPMAGLPALAQESPDNQGGNDSERNRLEEIVVTANKREQIITDVPMGITALGQQDLRELNVTGLEDYIRFVPGISFIARGESARSWQPNIRGVQLGRTGPTTAFYFDETPIQPFDFQRFGLPDPDVFDSNRVEVLKGPQGTLYGANSMGGAIKIVPNRPNSAEFEARIEGGLSKVQEGGAGNSIAGMVNFPLVEDRVALRMSATFDHDGGFIKGMDGEAFVPLEEAGFTPGNVNDAENVASTLGFLNESDVYTYRAALEWRATDNLTITPNIFLWNVQEGHGRQVSPGIYDASDGNILIFPIFLGFRSQQELNNELYNLKFDYDTDNFNVIFSSTFFGIDWTTDRPAANEIKRSGALPISTDEFFNLPTGNTGLESRVGTEDQVSVELRAASKSSGPFNVTGGVFYRDVQRDYETIYPSTGLEAFYDGFSIFFNTTDDYSIEEFAAFGEVRWNVNDKFEVTGGFRWSDYTRDEFQDTNAGNVSFPSDPVNGSVSESLTNFSASASWFLSDETTFYTRVAEGYRPGFPTLTNLPSACDQDLIDVGITPGTGAAAINSDNLTSFEAGVKGRMFNDRLAINLSAYYIDWKDIQVELSLDCGSNVEANAGEAEVTGFELELEANPSDSINLRLAVSLSDAQLSKDATALGGLKGDPLPEVGEWNGSFIFSYYPQAASQYGAYLRAEATYTDESLYNFRVRNPRPRDTKEDLVLASLRAGFDYQDWDVSFFLTNVLDERSRGQCRDTSQPIIGERITCVNQPRTFGVSLGRSF